MKNLCWIMGFLCLFSACGTSPIETLVIRGSDTEVNLVLILAEEYMNQNPTASIAVTGGGSGTGIAALINRKTDIANSSRRFKAQELQLAQERNIEVLPIVFAIDALSFVVHSSLPIDSLSLPELSAIFSGEIRNWRVLGGPDLPISLYGRQANSGTYIYIQREILKGDYDRGMKQMNGSAQIVEGIRSDPASIGYVGIGYVLQEDSQVLKGLKVLSVKVDESSQAVSPILRENILSGHYPVSRPLYQFVNGSPTGLLRSFLLYELSPTGQSLIVEGGYFPVNEHYQSTNEIYLNDD